MGFKVVYLPGFYSDLEGAIDWYNKDSAQRAKLLVEEIETTIEWLLKKPMLFQKLSSRTRKINLPIFPYKIIYQAYEGEILIIALAHHKRHPRYWKKRKV